MTSIHERAIVRPIGLLASLGLLTAYGAGFLITIVLVSSRSRSRFINQCDH